MSDDLKAKIDSIFAAKQSATQAHKDLATAQKALQEEFRAGFKAAVRDVVRPVFDEFARLLKARGAGAQIADSDGEYPSTVITFELPDAGQRRLPNFTLKCDVYTQRVIVEESTWSHSKRPGGSLRLPEVTAEMLEKRLLSLLGEVVQ